MHQEGSYQWIRARISQEGQREVVSRSKRKAEFRNRDIDNSVTPAEVAAAATGFSGFDPEAVKTVTVDPTERSVLIKRPVTAFM